VPEQQEIKTTKLLNVGNFPGFHYAVFDRYGHSLTFSRSYSTEAEAEKNLTREMKYGDTDDHAGPYTGLLWPAVAVVSAKVFVSQKEPNHA
jgi:hypothetical protein